jgi:hypothetical protein
VYIHNFYGDLLLAVRVLFDNHIFQNRNYVKRYEFNLGNRTLQLPTDYKPNFEFPNIIVSLNDETPSYGQRPEVSQKIPGFNLDQIPVLYNQTNLDVLVVQEEMVNVPISSTINCESQFQAKEIAALVKRWLPVNKFISFLSFTSYLEVSQEFLSSVHFDPAIHSIVNLYTKLNKRTGEVDYCYSLQYEPFVRLDSNTTAIPDSTQRSFQVVVDTTFMIPMPLFMFSDRLQTITERIDIQINALAAFEPINDYPSSKIINEQIADPENLKLGYIRRNLLISENTSTEIILYLDWVSLILAQVTNASTGGRNIVATKGADDYLYITVGTSETKYRVKMDTIPSFDLGYDPCTGLLVRPLPDGISIDIGNDEYLNIIQDLAGTIIVELRKVTRGLQIKFDPNDLQLTSAYSYNLVKGNNVLRDYQYYTLDIAGNSVILNFDDSAFSSYIPSTTSPLIVQFYLKDAKFPFQVGGVQPKMGLVKATNITQTVAEIRWLSDVPTTTQIEYAEESIDYNQLSSLDQRYTYNHCVVLRNLYSQLNYHFRINTLTENGEEYISDDYTFMTLPD